MTVSWMKRPGVEGRRGWFKGSLEAGPIVSLVQLLRDWR